MSNLSWWDRYGIKRSISRYTWAERIIIALAEIAQGQLNLLLSPTQWRAPPLALRALQWASRREEQRAVEAEG